jgi:hypothetical protein
MDEKLDTSVIERLCDEYVSRRVDQKRLLDEIQTMIKADDTNKIEALWLNVQVAWQHRVRLKELVATLEQAGYTEACLPCWSKQLLFYEVNDDTANRVQVVAVHEQGRFVISDTHVETDSWVDHDKRTVRTKSKLFLKYATIMGEELKTIVWCLDLKLGTWTQYELPVSEKMCEFYSGDGELTNDLLLLGATASEYVILKCEFQDSEPVLHNLEPPIKKDFYDESIGFFMSRTGLVYVTVEGQDDSRLILCDLQVGTSSVFLRYEEAYEFNILNAELFCIHRDEKPACRLFRWNEPVVTVFETGEPVLTWVHNSLLIQRGGTTISYLAADGTGKPRNVPHMLLK